MNSTSRTVVITGASSGIGLALARAYLARGFNVVGNARTKERLESAAKQLGQPANFLPVEGDIAKPETAQKIFERAIEAFGTVDILVNNAGIFIPKPIGDYTTDDFDNLINTNLKGFFYPSQRAAAHMSANRRGHIVNITASVAMQPNVSVPALLPVMVKGGLNHATKALALELASSNVKVNAVAPGIIDTPLHTPETHEFLKSLQPSGKIGNVQQIVDAVLYLTDAEFTTGVVLPVDGGATAGKW
ncbi:SDR family NAD(P)-dependent oxidoreductase [Burkholderia anthina]|uniref:SDR family NAD(P)-dependent oxidoreductase n=1 Tax=Burkholderia anthina TaxID=179879 RepID=UPI0007579497|nr:SDR family NAD(P)-dependent oxidoreductase [Burkholderia anthina]KVN53129.1 3-oxoacyl-ACP reductase [Burkholderia anthina]